jgi:hypothetical protein
MIIVKLQGGLGNQLFQYALGRHLALKDGAALIFDATYYSFVKNRRYTFDFFTTLGHKGSFREYPLFYPSTLPIIGKTYEALYHMFSPKNMKHITETKYYSFDPKILKQNGNVYLDGFWQNPKYFEKIWPTLQDELQFHISPSKKLQTYLKKINKHSVSLHVRRGDYTSLSSFGTCSIEYYKKAVQYILSKIKNPHFFVFSDDVAWAKINLSFLKNATYIEGLENEIEDLYLLHSCYHHVIANSTFSWWGARLSPHAGIVVAPTPWVNYEQKETDALYLKDWKKINREGK